MDSTTDTSTVTEVQIRPYRASDYPVLLDILVEAFTDVCIDQAIESELGHVAGSDWQWRKGRDLTVDLERDADGVLVADLGGRPIGLISTWQDAEASIGHIPNLAIAAEYRGRGVGRKLIEAAVERFRCAGLCVAKIETLSQNKRAAGLYTSEGFVEVARQLHLVKDLRGMNGNGRDT